MTAIDTANALVVGDVMRFSIELLDAMKAEPDAYARVSVKKIERQPDGTVVVWLEKAKT